MEYGSSGAPGWCPAVALTQVAAVKKSLISLVGFGSTTDLDPSWKVWCWHSRFSVKLDSARIQQVEEYCKAWIRMQREGRKEDLFHHTGANSTEQPTQAQQRCNVASSFKKSLLDRKIQCTGLQEDEFLVHIDRSSDWWSSHSDCYCDML